MIIFITVIHIIVCLGLIGIVLIQRGRGSGLIESFSGVESMFGTKTDAMLTRLTTIFSIVFFITCLLLAVLSLRSTRSLVINTKFPSEGEEKAARDKVIDKDVAPEKTPEQPVAAGQPQPK